MLRLRAESCDEALELLAPFHAELLPLLPALKPLWTHNDLHASNLLWSDASDDAQAVAIIDFGLADSTNTVHDLAQAIERNIVEWLELMRDSARGENVPVHIDHLLALLDGYESVQPTYRRRGRGSRTDDRSLPRGVCAYGSGLLYWRAAFGRKGARGLD